MNAFEALFENGIIPIVNENDVSTIDEIKIGDNDQLAAKTAQIINADLLILLSDIDGLYTKNPKKFPDAKFIPLVTKISEDIENMASDSISNVGTGGMITKIKAAKIVSKNCDVVIMSGIKTNPIHRIINNQSKFTYFHNISK